MISGRCALDLLWGYCKEIVDGKSEISFIAPCRAGRKILCGSSITTCPNYMSLNKIIK